MTLTFSRLLADAWSLFRRQADLILRIALPLVVFPAFAVQLLCDPLPPLPPPPRDQPMLEAWIAQVGVWGQTNAIWYLLADAVSVFGLAAIAILLLDPDRPVVAGALRTAGTRLVAFILASLLIAVPVGMSMWLFVLPGLWVQGRLSAVIPLLARAPGQRVVPAIRTSWRATRGAGFALAGAVVSVFLLQWLAIVPLLSADEWLRAPGNDNPLVLSVVDGGIALLGGAYHLSVLMIGVAAYIRLARKGS
ncbi:hypothetical protein SAMN05216382_1730 [Sphingomonas palmae]|uniref:Membrane domain of glycerophosphoryl diester phosphodiesterase n=1 Tax=Sphingomonas palmae TaxID=1855283 RepID=A0A1H7P076_9SPHN|nr:hypothetical protein [Sphingomonas palmae]SEL29222.1 hypothetical protein SAMN05216382_1730 [Sphingomonas palmae]